MKVRVSAAGALALGVLLATAGLSPVRAAPVPFGPQVVPLAETRSAAGGAHPDVPDSAVIGGRLVFAAEGGTTGTEVWVSDGTPAGTGLLADIAAGPTGSEPEDFIAFRGRVWFTAFRPDVGREWWVTDGTSAGTRLFADLRPGGGSFAHEPATGKAPLVLGDQMYFPASGGDTGEELWSTDGTVAGTRQVADLSAGPRSSFPGDLTRLGNRVAFTATPSDNIVKPYVSDGTPAGTVRLDAEAASVDVRPEELTVVGDQLFFRGQEPGTGHELWSSRGAVGDAHPVRDIVPGVDSSNPTELTRLGSTLCFVAFDAVAGAEVWTSDGTPGGTQLLRDIGPPGGDDPSDLFAAGPTLYFAADDGVHGRELWRTSGSMTSTRLVRDVNPGAGAGSPVPLASVDGRLVFSARSSGTPGPWLTDGTEAGTRTLGAPAAGATDSHLWSIGVLGKTVVLAASVGGGEPLFGYTVPSSSTRAHPHRSYRKRAAKRRKIVLPVVVSSSSPLSGTVTLVRHGRVVGRGPVVAGKARVRIQVRLEPGRHRLSVRYGGSIDAQPSATVTTIRVRRR